jgi:general secretion pathway protein G
MRSAILRRTNGFTIVELLVVIVVIGILAAVTIVSYTGISSKATISSMQSDLSTSSQRLKMYYTDNGTYPTQMDYSGSSFCPTPIDARYCLKGSLGNTYSYSSASSSTFRLTVTNTNGTIYVVTESTSPSPLPPPIFASGGVINPTTGTRTHTFGASCASGTPCTITATASGTITIVINGGGGGGGGSGRYVMYDGNPGGQSSIAYLGGTWFSYGGTGGGSGDGWWDSPGAPGIDGGTAVQAPATMTGWTSAPGGGASGRIGGTGQWGGTGGTGGNGGRLNGTLNVSTGQSLTVIVGGGGAGGTADMDSGTTGDDGSVVISYSY